jgi:NAD(P)-dependent dehydrogenase (short-subunit alcohol dehydrogenase family)
MSKTWFITGATRGIGLEIARAALADRQREMERWRALSVSTDALAAA